MIKSLQELSELTSMLNDREEKLRKSKEEWERTFDAVPELISILDIDHKIIRVNKAFKEFYNGESPDFFNRKCYIITHKTEEPIKECPLEKILLEKHPCSPSPESCSCEVYDSTRNRWFWTTISPICDKEDNLEYIVHVTRDITNQKLLWLKERDISEFAKLILDTTNALILVFDEKGIIRKFNKMCIEVSGFSDVEIEGIKTWEFLIPDDEFTGVKNTVDDLFAGNFPNKHYNRWKTKNGGKTDCISWRNSAVLNPDGTVRYVIATGIIKPNKDDLSRGEK